MDRKSKGIGWVPIVLLICISVCYSSQAAETTENEKQQVSLYEINCQKADGQNGCYKTKPEVTVTNRDKEAITKYKLLSQDGELLCGEAKGEDGLAVLNPEDFGEGENTLEVWMEIPILETPEAYGEIQKLVIKSGEQKSGEQKDGEQKDEGQKAGNQENQEWRELEGTKQTLTFMVDSLPPGRVTFEFEESTMEDGLVFREATTVRLIGSDEGTGVDGFRCRLNDGEEQYIAGESGVISVPVGFKGILYAAAVDKAGNQGPNEASKEIICEGGQPSIKMSAPDGFETWYDEDVIVSVSVEDEGISAGLKSIRCFVNGELQEQVNFATGIVTTSAQAEISVIGSSTNGNAIPIIIESTDRAGNISSKSEMIYMDKTAPEIRIIGAADYLIVSKPLEVSCVVEEENILAQISAQMQWEDIQKQVHTAEYTNWSKEERSQNTTIPLEEDGSYQLKVTAEDAAGHHVEQILHVIVDRTNPVIRYVEQLRGSYLPYFQWNYDIEDMIRDYTSYSYHITVDHHLYQMKEKITGEGIHLLQVEVEDAAGNESKAEANFIVDHTAPVVDFGDVEDGKTYEDSVMLTIALEKQEDDINTIIINGEMQTIQSGKIFRFPIEEVGDYEISVEAQDPAGNVTQEAIQFSVKAQETMALRMMTPIRKVIEKARGVKGNSRWTEQSIATGIMICMVCLIGIGLALAVRYRFLKRKKLPEREDAEC